MSATPAAGCTRACNTSPATRTSSSSPPRLARPSRLAPSRSSRNARADPLAGTPPRPSRQPPLPRTCCVEIRVSEPRGLWRSWLADLANAWFASASFTLVVAQQRVDHRIPPGAVPEGHTAQHPLPRKADAFQGFLLGDVVRIGERLQPVDPGELQQVVHQQPLRRRPKPMAPVLGQ